MEDRIFHVLSYMINTPPLFDIPFDLGKPCPGDKPLCFEARILWSVAVDDRYQQTSYWKQGFPRNALFFTASGEGYLEIPGKRSSQTSGSFAIVKKGTACRYGCAPKSRWQFHCVGFEAKADLNAYGMDYNTHYQIRGSAPFESFFSTMISEAASRKPYFRIKIDLLLQELLVGLGRETFRQLQKKPDPLENALTWMHTHPNQPLDLDRLVQPSGLCRTGFFKCFLEKTGKSPARYFLDFRLESARIMIDGHRGTLREIAELTGFYDEFYFSRMFKKKYGLSPARYRERQK